MILAGGSGSRLFPLTKVTNKALLPVYNKPMIYYSIDLLVKADIRDVLVICGGNSLGDFLPLLGNGEAFGLNEITYRVQSQPRGIADALGLARDWAEDDPICVVLSDNIFEHSFKKDVDAFKEEPKGARIFLTEVDEPEHYGVVEFDEYGQVITIEEKPKNPKSNHIATGIYMYDSSVWGFIDGLTPSARGELEITDVNNHYLNVGELKSTVIDGFWGDCGESFESYLDACNKAKDIQ